MNVVPAQLSVRRERMLPQQGKQRHVDTRQTNQSLTQTDFKNLIFIDRSVLPLSNYRLLSVNYRNFQFTEKAQSVSLYKVFKAGATSGNQASCSMRLLGKQLLLHLPLLVFAPAHIVFRLLSLSLLGGYFTKDSQ